MTTNALYEGRGRGVLWKHCSGLVFFLSTQNEEGYQWSSEVVGGGGRTKTHRGTPLQHTLNTSSSLGFLANMTHWRVHFSNSVAVTLALSVTVIKSVSVKFSMKWSDILHPVELLQQLVRSQNNLQVTAPLNLSYVIPPLITYTILQLNYTDTQNKSKCGPNHR